MLIDEDDVIWDYPPECGEEHPRLHGNECILEYGHKDRFHEDADGNTWYGTNSY